MYKYDSIKTVDPNIFLLSSQEIVWWRRLLSDAKFYYWLPIMGQPIRKNPRCATKSVSLWKIFCKRIPFERKGWILLFCQSPWGQVASGHSFHRYVDEANLIFIWFITLVFELASRSFSVISSNLSKHWVWVSKKV